MKISKRTLVWTLAALAIAVAVILGVRYAKAKKSALPEGIATGNGRLEGKLVDVGAKEPLRVREVLVEEGALVQPAQVLVRLDTTTLEAELTEARESIAAAEEKLAFSKASITKQRSEVALAQTELDRAGRMLKDRAASQREVDVRKAKLESARASLTEAEAALQTAAQQVEVARASAATVQTRIDDATLRSPVVGRVLYRLAEPGEVLAAGGKALTLVNLEDVYMEIFLPSEEAARVPVGAEGRITLDYAPDRALPGKVSFVSPEAQFTPKQVETRSEREKLMFRVKIQLPRELATEYVEQIKTGVRGMGFVKVDPEARWPDRLQNLIQPPRATPQQPPPQQPQQQQPQPPPPQQQQQQSPPPVRGG